VHQNAKNRPFDRPDLRAIIDASGEKPDVVKPGIVAMSQDMS
jgi:hypothetical protein